MIYTISLNFTRYAFMLGTKVFILHEDKEITYHCLAGTTLDFNKEGQSLVSDLYDVYCENSEDTIRYLCSKHFLLFRIMRHKGAASVITPTKLTRLKRMNHLLNLLLVIQVAFILNYLLNGLFYNLAFQVISFILTVRYRYI